ncbi:MAG TPA: hypothetical protein VGK58_12305 [Lacipirellulaceae bacterium]
MNSIVELFKGILSIPVPFNMFVLVTLIFCTTGVITSFFKQIRKYACYRRDIDLKRELVERGLSVDEIERIVAAKGSAAIKESES